MKLPAAHLVVAVPSSKSPLVDFHVPLSGGPAHTAAALPTISAARSRIRIAFFIFTTSLVVHARCMNCWLLFVHGLDGSPCRLLRRQRGATEDGEGDAVDVAPFAGGVVRTRNATIPVHEIRISRGKRRDMIGIADLLRVGNRKAHAIGRITGKRRGRIVIADGADSVSYTHLTLPTSDLV